MIDSMLAELSILIRQSLYMAPVFALIAGILVSFTPCSVSAIPLLLAYLGGTGQRDTKRSFWLSVTFVSGSAITFSVFGAAASLSGSLIGNASRGWYIFLGVIMVLMALQIWGIINIIPPVSFLTKNKKKGFAGAFLAGILGGVFSSPCSTPVLIVLLAIAADQGRLGFGILLFFCYSVGHGILAVALGCSTPLAGKLLEMKKTGVIFKVVIGLGVLLIGLYMFYLGF